jgi:restriction endonuclease S subunit
MLAEQQTEWIISNNLYLRDLKDLAIPLLPIKEQQKIIDSIQQKEKEIQVLKEKIEANK